MEHFIPQHWFVNQPQWLLVAICIVAMAVLLKGADWLVDGVAGIAYRFRISKAVVAATVLSLGTTSPETAVSVTAAVQGDGSLALGNAVGSFIANAALIFGLGALIARLPADRYILWRQGAWQAGAALLLAGACYARFAVDETDGMLGRPSGVLMLLLLAVYIGMSVYWGRSHHRYTAPRVDIIADQAPPPRRGLVMLAVVSLLGLAAVIFASRFFVGSVTVLSEDYWRIPKVVVAATLVSFGTSLPELVISLTSVYRGQGEVLVGNVLGANVMNILWVAGAAAVARPLPLTDPLAEHPNIFLFLHLPAMLIVVGLFTLYIALSSHRTDFRRWYGIPLLVIYMGYVVAQLVMS